VARSFEVLAVVVESESGPGAPLPDAEDPRRRIPVFAPELAARIAALPAPAYLDRVREMKPAAPGKTARRSRSLRALSR